MILRRASILSGPPHPRSPTRLDRRADRRPVLLLVLVFALGTFGCTVRHRSALAWPDSAPVPTDGLVSAGIVQATRGELEPAVSRRLADASGLVDIGGALTHDDRRRLLAEPARLAFARASLRALSERIGHRHVLIGELAEIHIETSNEWLVMVFLDPGVAFSIPFPFSRREGVPHPSFELRVVDLETGRVDAEFFAMMPPKAVRRGISSAQLEAALRAMGLAKETR